MQLKATLIIVFAAVLAMGGGWAVLAARADRPPLHGEMRDFTVLPHAIPVPQARFTDPGRGTASLGQFKGQLLLINLWATWCGPCVEELPSLWKLKRTKEGPAFRVVNIAEDHAGIAAINSFLVKHGVEGLDHFADPDSAVGFALGVNGLPTTFLIGKDSRVIGRLEGKADWNSPDARALIDWYLTRDSQPDEPKIEKTALP